MPHKPMQAGRKFMAVFMAATLCVLAMAEPSLAQTESQSRDVKSLEARVRELQATGSKIQVELADGTALQGRIIRAEADSFTIRQEKTDQEVAFQYGQVTQVTQVTEVTKKGRSLGRKIAVIAVIATAGTLLVLCIAPYPIGFLCRKDPS